MGKQVKKRQHKNTGGSKMWMFAGLIFVIAILIFVYNGFAGKQPAGQAAVPQAQSGSGPDDQEDLAILKNEVTEKVKFYPYRANGTYMEVMAVKASDGTIRTAFNTCQVCFDSGRGYYEQQGDTVVCQNCGNVFKIDAIEKMKNGCNPVPILQENKTEDDEKVVIAKSYLADNSDYFKRWKK